MAEPSRGPDPRAVYDARRPGETFGDVVDRLVAERDAKRAAAGATPDPIDELAADLCDQAARPTRSSYDGTAWAQTLNTLAAWPGGTLADYWRAHAREVIRWVHANVPGAEVTRLRAQLAETQPAPRRTGRLTDLVDALATRPGVIAVGDPANHREIQDALPDRDVRLDTAGGRGAVTLYAPDVLPERLRRLGDPARRGTGRG